MKTAKTKLLEEMTLEDHLEVVLSNTSERLIDQVLTYYHLTDTFEDLRECLRGLIFYEHPPTCQGGYSNDRCPCAWVWKGFHTMLAVCAIDDIARQRVFPEPRQ